MSSNPEREIRNPADISEVVGTYPLLGAGDVDAAVEAAHKAQAEWAARPAVERAEVLKEAADRWPFALTAVKVVPALLAGNAVIVKPASNGPFGGVRQSGLGRELALPGLAACTEPHTISTRHL